MSKNIYTLLGFKGPQELIYSNELIHEAKNIFDKIPSTSIAIKPLIIEQNILEETLAISTAEDSNLTLSIAKKINLSEEQSARLIKYKKDTKLSNQEKYDYLEFENIKAVENIISDVSFESLNIKLISDLHHDLTIGLDEYSKDKGVSHYHSGKLRQSDKIKVGKIKQYTPPKHKEVESLLKSLFKEFSNRKIIEIYDILEFHILFYAIHPFQNGNKRVARILESMLLSHYGYSADRTLSLSIYYKEKKDGFHFFLLESLRKKEVTPFMNFSIRGYFYSGYQLINKISELTLSFFEANFNRYIDEFIKKISLNNYKKACKAIINLNGVFTHTEFTNEMKSQGCTIGVSQNIIQNLLQLQTINKHNTTYYIKEALEIENARRLLNQFLLKNNISVEI